MDSGKPLRLPLAVEPGTRDYTAAKDARLVNCFAEVIGEQIANVIKRPGRELWYAPPVAAANGIYTFFENGLAGPVAHVFFVAGTLLYKDSTYVGTVVGTRGSYSFSACLGTTPLLFFHTSGGPHGVDTDIAYTYNPSSGLVTQVTDADFPANLVPGSVYLDGTTYVMTPSGDICGSGLNDPTSWDPLNKIVAQGDSERAVGLAKQLAYVVAFKQYSIEVFYDAGNAAGSPLGTVQGAMLNVGCLNADTIQSIDGTLFWVASTRRGGCSIWRMAGLKGELISNPAINKILQGHIADPMFSFGTSFQGHIWYGLTIPAAHLTLVFDASSRSWYYWTTAGNDYLALVGGAVDSTGRVVFQNYLTGAVETLNALTPTDLGVTFPVDIYTPPFDGGSRKKKTELNLEVAADQEPGSYMDVRYSDTDYQTWTEYRRLDLSVPRARLTKGGSFYRRAYHFHHERPTPLRITNVELQLLEGTL